MAAWRQQQDRPARWLMLAAIIALLVVLPGCRGCRQSPDETPEEAEKRSAEERAKKEKPKPKPDFELKLVTWPCSRGKLVNGVKPGHWSSIALAEAKTNNFDFVGDWEMEATERQGNQDTPAPLPATAYTMATSRQVALPKGQAKTLESLLLVPPVRRGMGVSYQLRGRQHYESSQAFTLMPSYEYHFVVLARWPERYTYLGNMDSIRPPSRGFSLEPHDLHYYVTLASPGSRLPLPSQALLWTSIACVLLDDVDAAALDSQQQQAMLDWLHWGGQLILSGPDTLDSLGHSFLAPYLPATAGGARAIQTSDLEKLSNHWSGPMGRSLRPARPWAGIRLKKTPQAEFLPDTGDLLVERAVGRGRIVVSAFHLSGPELVNWPGWDGLFNACLLRRPPRQFFRDPEEVIQIKWHDDKAHPHPLDAGLNSRLRFFSRDTGVTFDSYAADLPPPPSNGSDLPSKLPVAMNEIADPPPGPGMAAWNDFSPVAKAARQSLQQASGIKVLNRMFVVWMVAGYIILLVPVNWLVFRLLGRVEWAWAAAPLIAVVCTVVVIHMAQLDIGFVRAENEIAVVELHNDYPRAHVTRYTALYTSLATGYRFSFDKPGAMLLPFPTVDSTGDFRMLVGQGYDKLTCRHGDDASVAGYSVGSNSIGFVHSEQWLDLAQPLAFSERPDGSFQLVNHTQFLLRDVGVVKKTEEGGLQTAWLGAIEAGGSVMGKFEQESATISGSRLWKARRDRSPRTAADAPSGELNLHRLIDIAQDVRSLRPGEIRLVAWLDDALPGLTVEPKASQARHAAVVVAQLAAGREELPRPDASTRAEAEALPVPGGTVVPPGGTGVSPVCRERTGETPVPRVNSPGGTLLPPIVGATVQLSPQKPKRR